MRTNADGLLRVDVIHESFAIRQYAVHFLNPIPSIDQLNARTRVVLVVLIPGVSVTQGSTRSHLV